MAHNIYRDSTGKDCMFVVGDRKAAWHELGQRVDGAVSWTEAMTLAGLDWKVVKNQNYCRNAQGKVMPTKSYTIYRDSDNAELGTVGEGFTVRQNDQHFQFVDALLEANGGSHYDSAGALGNGARIWCAVRVPKADITVAGIDKSETYLVFATAHDGSMAHTAKLSSVRVVCQNTLSAAMSDEGACFRVKHTRNADARLDRAKQALTGVTMDAKRLEDKLNLLAARRLTRDTMVMALDRLFPKPKEETASPASQTKRENLLADVLALYESNDKDAFPIVRGTAYN
jgi:phage/plasmid-like protein (TIGR03299 family)